MTTLTVEFPENLFETFRRSPRELATEVRVAAAIQWYRRGLVSLDRAAELAGLTVEAFHEAAELRGRAVSAEKESFDFASLRGMGNRAPKNPEPRFRCDDDLWR